MPKSQFRLPRICEHCGKPFEAKTVSTRFCSTVCGNKANKERIRQELEENRKQTLLEHAAAHIAEIQTRPYITVAEATELFGISKDTIRRLIKRGKLPAVNLGERLTRISRTHIEEMFTAVRLPEQEEQLKKPVASKPVTVTEKLQKQPAKDLSLPDTFNPEDYCTLGEVVKKYGKCSLTVNSYLNKYEVPRYRFGRTVYLPKAQVDTIFQTTKKRKIL